MVQNQGWYTRRGTAKHIEKLGKTIPIWKGYSNECFYIKSDEIKKRQHMKSPALKASKWSTPQNTKKGITWPWRSERRSIKVCEATVHYTYHVQIVIFCFCFFKLYIILASSSIFLRPDKEVSYKSIPTGVVISEGSSASGESSLAPAPWEEVRGFLTKYRNKGWLWNRTNLRRHVRVSSFINMLQLQKWNRQQNYFLLHTIYL